MSLGVQNPIHYRPGDDSSKVFDYEFEIVANTDLDLIAILNSDGTQYPLTLNTHYTVTGAGDSDGGQVTLTQVVDGMGVPTEEEDWLDSSGNLLSTFTLMIRRNRSNSQDASIRNQGPSYRSAIEVALDKLAMLIQQLQVGVNRSVKLPLSMDPDNFSTLAPFLTAGAMLRVNAGVTGFELVDSSTFIGATGDTGATGASVLTGSGAPGSGLGQDGDSYIDTATGNVYTRAAGAWSITSTVAIIGSSTQQSLADGATADIAGLIYSSTNTIFYEIEYCLLRGSAREFGKVGFVYSAGNWNKASHQKSGNQGLSFDVNTATGQAIADLTATGTAAKLQWRVISTFAVEAS